MYWRNSQKLLGWAIFETGACPYHHQNSLKSDQKKRELKAATYSEKKDN
jgi:hypothetical protein